MSPSKRKKQAEPDFGTMREFLDSVGEAVIIIDRDRKILYMNEVALHTWGRPRGRRCHRFLHSSREPCEGCPLEEVLAGKEPVKRESRMPAAPGGWRTYETIYLFARGPDGAGYAVLVSRDIQEQKTLEREVMREKELSRALLDSVNTIVLGFDAEGSWEFMNRAARELCGVEEGVPGPGEAVSRLVPRDAEARAREYFESPPELRREEQPVLIPLQTSSGERRMVSWTYTPLLVGAGEIEGALALGQDVTERYSHRKSVEKLAEELTVVNRILSVAGTAATVEEMMAGVLEALLEVPGFKLGGAYLLERGMAEARLVAQRGFERAEPRPVITGHADRFPGTAVVNRRIEMVGVDDPMHPYAQEVLRAEELKVAVAVPIAPGGHPTGLLVLCHEGEPQPPSESMDLLRAAAEALELGGENVFLRNRAENRAREAASLLHVAQVLAGTLELSDALERVAAEAAALMKADLCSIFLLNESTGRMRRRARVGWRQETYDIEDSFLLSSSPLLQEVASTLKPLALDGTAGDPRLPERASSELGIKSTLAVPLVSEGRFTGAIMLDMTTEARVFTGREIELMESFASQAATVIRNATLVSELTDSEGRYRALVDGSMFGVFLHDGKEILYVNERALQISGRTPEEFRTMEQVLGVVVAEDRPRVVDRMRRRIAGEEVPARYDTRIRRPDGSTVVVQLGNTLMELGGRQVVLVTVNDVTARVRAEEAVKASETRYRTLVETSGDAILMVNPRGTVLFANSASSRLTGLAPGELIGRSVYSFVHPDERDAVSGAFMTAWEAGKGISRMPIRVMVSDRERLFEVTTAIMGEPGPASNVMLIARDVTEVEHARARLAESEERYRTIVEKNRDAIIVTNRAGEVLYANPQVEALIGVPPGEAVGQHIFRYVHPEDRERAAADFVNDWKTGQTVPNYPLRCVRPDGTVVDVEATSGIVGWPAEDAQQIFVLRDVTERQAREAERETQLKVEESLAALAVRFVDPGDIGEAVQETLEGVGQTLGAARCFFTDVEDQTRLGRTREWVGPSTIPLSDRLLGTDLKDFDWLLGSVLSRQEVVVEDLGVVPEGPEARELDRSGITAFAVMPVFVRDTLRGLLGCTSTDPGRAWSVLELNLLREIAGTFSRALETREFVDELERSERFRTRITESMDEGLFVLTNGVITWANSRAGTMYGYTPDEMYGQNTQFLMPEPARYKDVTSEMLQALSESEAFVLEDKVRRKDGSMFDVTIAVTELGVEEGKGQLLVAVTDITQEKRMREEVAAAASAYSTLFSKAGDALLVHNVNGRVRDANERASLYTGYDREELLEMSVTDLVAPRVRHLYAERKAELEEDGSTTFETDLVRKDGGSMPVEVTAHPTRIWGDEVVLSSMRDISERRKAEEETQRRASQLLALNEIVKAAASSLDVETAAEAILGVAMEVLGADAGMMMLERSPGKGDLGLAASRGRGHGFAGAKGAAPLKEMATWIASPSPVSMIIDTEAEGRTGWMVTSASALREAGLMRSLLIPLKSGGKLMGVIALGSQSESAFGERDLEFYNAVGAEIGVSLENAVIYRELALEHERLSLLYRSAQSISGELDLETMLNATAAEAARAVGAAAVLLALIEPDSDEFHWAASYNLDLMRLQGVVLPVDKGFGGAVVAAKRAVLVPAGDEVPAELRVIIERDPVPGIVGGRLAAGVPLISGDKVVGVMGLHVPEDRPDLTGEDALLLEAIGRQAGVALENARLYVETRRHLEALEKAHQELMVLDRMKSDFVSTVSHELRSPLAVIEGFAKTMVEHFDRIDRETERESLEIILKKSIALEGLIENILDMSRIEEGRLEVSAEEFDLVAACARVSADQERVAEVHRVVLDTPENGMFVVADREKLEVAIGNLVRNAVKFSPEGGQVTVRACEDSGVAVISVIDQGIGIPEEELERVFDRFYQVDSSETRSFPGTGLGLYITRELVEAMGGDITVQSETGRGSTFTITVPLAR
ncbi:MAG: PAS domain S-box protein [Actinobacteria bacterium]|nr:PAS domain S-box protein [Actinomycetota bacterium]MBU1943602.1 PAS domain S-box protein [Actinomycetota bacterium]MBU2688935.1 PAS domain S-box protein [Actinomycetota bacterium]